MNNTLLAILPSLNSLFDFTGASGIGHAATLFDSVSVAPFLAAANAGDLPAKLKEVLNILMAFGFLYGTVRIMGGAMQMHRGDTEEGKQSIIAGALIAAAPMIMRILFGIFVEGGATL